MQDKIETVKRTLEDSDIVWSKYGSDTIEDLAERIVERLGGTQSARTPLLCSCGEGDCDPGYLMCPECIQADEDDQ